MRGAFLLLLLSACRATQSAPQAQQSPCATREFEGSRFTVCDAKAGEIRLVAAKAGEAASRNFSDLLPEIDPARVAFAMNGGMFDDDGRPIGLAVVGGQQVHAINRREGGGNFHLLPNGVFLVRSDGRAEVVETQAFEPAEDIQSATQSGPMLVIDGRLHPRIELDGQSRYVRNGVGVRDGKALFVITQDPVSFGKLARFFRDRLKTPNALYLDGSVSSLWDPAGNRQDSHSPLGPIVIVLKPAG